MTRVNGVRVRPDVLYIASGWNVLITDVNGRLGGVGPQGFYARNTRVLDLERITVDGEEPQSFSTAIVGAHAQVCFAKLVDGETLPRRGAYLTVERFVGEGLRTRVTVRSYSDTDHRFRIRVDVGTDFADTEEAESGKRQQTGEVVDTWDASSKRLRLDYEHPQLDLAVAITVETAAAVSYDDRSFTIDLSVAPGQSAAFDLVTTPIIDGETLNAPDAGYAERTTLLLEPARHSQPNWPP